ncbi:MAG: hypothetical protein WC503_00595 [Candidatus Shapirobacteria bacterium]
MSLFLFCAAMVVFFEMGFVTSSLFAMNRLDDRKTAKIYLTELFLTVAPQCTPGDSLVDLVAQIDNYIAGQNDKIKKLKEEYIELKEEYNELESFLERLKEEEEL